VTEHHRLEVAIYSVEEDLLLSDMHRFVKEGTALSPPSLSFFSMAKEFVRSVRDCDDICPSWNVQAKGGTKKHSLTDLQNSCQNATASVVVKRPPSPQYEA
jgi:hypothetical protein